MKLSEAKSKANLSKGAADLLIQAARKTLVERLRDTNAFRSLVEKMKKEPGEEKTGNLVMDQEGWLCYEVELTLDDCLCTDEEGDADEDLARAVLEEVAPEFNPRLADGMRTGSAENWVLSMSFGEPCIVNVPPERNCYAVYSHELKLQLDKDEVKSEEHALLLVEQAMRKAGCFGDVVSLDRNGCPTRLDVGQKARDATDTELQAMIDAMEAEEAE